MRLVNFLGCLVVTLVISSIAYADVPKMINYQGKITRPSGALVDTTTSMVFSIYTDSTGGTALWTETQTSVDVQYGVFSVLLGSVSPIPDSVFNGNVRYLGVKVGDDSEMAPRKAIVSVGYAYHSGTADTAYFAMPDADWTIGPDSNIYRELGNVGIGTISPQFKLEVKGQLASYDGTTGAFLSQINDDGVVGNLGYGNLIIRNSVNAAYITKTGSVGIGITSPAYKLDVNGDIRSNGTIYGLVDNADKVDGNHYNTNWPTTLTNVRSACSNDFHNIGGTDDDVPDNDAEVPDNISINNGRLYAPSGSGNVGIGTTSPGYNLHVNGNFYANSVNTGLGNYELYAMNQNVQTTDNPTFNRVHLSDYGTALGGFHVGGTSDPGTDNLIVDGNVGIGTTSPGYKLDVTGSGRFTTNLAVGSASFPDPKSAVLSASGGSSGSGVAGRSDNGSLFGVWGYNSAGYGIGCGTGSPSSAALQAIAYNNEANRTAIQCNGSLNATGTITASSIWNGVNAITGTTSGDYSGVSGISTAGGNGIYGSSVSGYAGYFQGNVRVTGTLTKGGGSFKIDHPLDPANKYLSHSFVESPDMMNIYNGNVILDSNGEAWIELPEWFEALNRDFHYQLTAIGKPGPNLYIENEISGNRFKIAGGEDGMKVCWQVTGVRKDPYAEAHRIQVEEEKPPHELGKYLYPRELGMPETLGINYQETQTADRR